MKKIIFLFSAFLASSSFAQAPYSVKTFFLKGGISAPVFGHWGDGDAGFKPAGSISALFIKDIDEGLSWGIEGGYDTGHKNRSLNLKVSIFNLSPVLFSWLGMAERKYYVYIGPGVYHWSSPRSGSFDSSSGTEFGFKAGGGFLKPWRYDLLFGADLRLEHLFDMSGENFNLGSANNFIFSLTAAKRI